MKLNELTKSELCGLLEQLFKCSFACDYMFYNIISQFLLTRWNEKSKELEKQFTECNILEDFEQFRKINKKQDELHSNIDYYTTLEEYERYKKQ